MVRMELSQTKQYYLKGRALSYDEEIIKNLHHRAIEASAAFRKVQQKCENNFEKIPRQRLDHTMSICNEWQQLYIYLATL